MNKLLAVLLVLSVLVVSGCAGRKDPTAQYKTISGPSDKVLSAEAAQGWTPVGISVGPDGTKWFVLQKTKGDAARIEWEYKTVSGKTEEVLNEPLSKGWEITGSFLTADGTKWFLLKKPKA
jgi:hypothetical protein